MLSDDFTTERVSYQGRSYRCIEHAQWSIFWDAMDVEAKYLHDDDRFEIEFPSTDRYKRDRVESVKQNYLPTFLLPNHGYVYHVDRMVSGWTLTGAERLSNHTDEAVYLVEGRVETPRQSEVTNGVTECRGQEPPKSGRRMLHDGRRFRFGLPKVAADVYASEIARAARLAKELR